jgi:hypothetical protein
MVFFGVDLMDMVGWRGKSRPSDPKLQFFVILSLKIRKRKPGPVFFNDMQRAQLHANASSVC